MARFLKTTNPADRKVCDRCKGTGNTGHVVVWNGERGGCFKCAGYGVLPTAEERAAAARLQKARHIVEVEDAIEDYRIRLARRPAHWATKGLAAEIAKLESHRAQLVAELEAL